jgi:hypothetical protein
MVTQAVPFAALVEAAKVTVLLVSAIETGLNEALTPLGSPLAVRPTLPVKPPARLTARVLVLFARGVTLRLAGLADSAKSDVPPSLDPPRLPQAASHGRTAKRKTCVALIVLHSLARARALEASLLGVGRVDGTRTGQAPGRKAPGGARQSGSSRASPGGRRASAASFRIEAQVVD